MLAGTAVNAADNPNDLTQPLPPPGYAVRLGWLYTDNIARSPDNPMDELIDVLQLDTNLNYDGPRLQALLDSSLGYRHYSRQTFDDEARGTLLAQANYAITPQLFHWNIADRLTNAPIDPLQNATPANIQFVNVAETGPEFNFRLSDEDRLDASYSYGDLNAQDTPIDQTRRSSMLDWTHDLSSNSSFIVALNGRRVEFTDPNAPTSDFDQNTGYLGYNLQDVTVTLDLAAGRTRTKLVGSPVQDVGVGWLRASFQRTPTSRLDLNFIKQASDAGGTLIEAVAERTRILPLIVLGDPYVSKEASGRYTRGSPAAQWSLEAGRRQLDFFETQLDQARRWARLSASSTLSSRFSAGISAEHDKVDYRDIVRQDDVYDYSLSFGYRMSVSWSLSTELHYFRRDSSDPSQAFRERWAILSLEYAPRWVR